MFPGNNPLFVEKLVRTKQAEIMNEIQGNSVPEYRDNLQSPIKRRVNSKMWALHRAAVVVQRTSLNAGVNSNEH